MVTMTPADFRQGLTLLATTQVGFAELAGVDPRTVRRWALGERKIPTWVGRHMSLMLKVRRLAPNRSEGDA